MNPDFFERIRQFNAMYRMPQPAVPTLDHNRMMQFEKILKAEVSEVTEIYAEYEAPTAGPVKLLAMEADWLGDLIIYCTSELVRRGFNPEEVLGIIMASNMSKMGQDGPIYDEDMKLQKGPNYWKPEPMLEKYITLAINTDGASA
jgi:hypothetical protein